VRFGLVLGWTIRATRALELNSGVFDPESFVQFVRDRFQQLIVELRFTFHDMRGAGSLGCAQTPDVEVMDFGHAGKLFEETFDRTGIDPARHSIESEADGIAQQTPCSDKNDDDDDETADRIEQQPAGAENNNAGHYHAR